MATYYGVNATKRLQDNPVQNLMPSEQHGRVRVSYDKYTASGALSLGDVLVFGKVPKGARVIDVICSADDLGTTGSLNLGWAAGDNGDEAASANGFLASVDLNSAAAVTLMSGSQGNAGHFKKFDDDCNVQATLAAATTAGGDIEVAVLYVLD